MNKEPELVDLGLPSENLWMAHNLGTNSETDYGNYYQWGSLIGYQGVEALRHSSWKTCPFNNGENGFEEEYFKANRYKWIYKNGILRPNFDIITQTYGNDYKIPDLKDFQELLEYTIKESIKNYKMSGVNGILFTSKINGNSIFIPFSGYTWNGDFYGVGSYCYLWSSRLYSNVPPGCAYNFACNSDNIELLGYSGRYDGFTIRGIKEG